MINIQDILKIEPTLTFNGLDNNPNSIQLDDPRFITDHLRQIEVAIDWLSKIKRRKSRVKYRCSYGLKHRIEAEGKTYISNGALIAACVAIDYPYKKYPDSYNIAIPIPIEVCEEESDSQAVIRYFGEYYLRDLFDSGLSSYKIARQLSLDINERVSPHVVKYIRKKYFSN